MRPQLTALLAVVFRLLDERQLDIALEPQMAVVPVLDLVLALVQGLVPVAILGLVLVAMLELAPLAAMLALVPALPVALLVDRHKPVDSWQPGDSALARAAGPRLHTRQVPAAPAPLVALLVDCHKPVDSWQPHEGAPASGAGLRMCTREVPVVPISAPSPSMVQAILR